MHNLRRFYYQNKEKIWKVILIIAFILGLIYFMNYRLTKKYSNNTEAERAKEDLQFNIEGTNINITDKEAISGESITQEEVKKINDIISVFLQYCKDGKSEEAYNMLSEDCKETRYTSIEKFIDQYIKVKFSKDKMYTVQKWQYNTYKIDILEDILATGNLNNKEAIVEYITIENQNNEKKLNINSYIKKSKINKEKTEKQLKVKVVEKNVYMDYEEYNLEIENLSEKAIRLGETEKKDTIYLKDRDGNKYNARIHEILEEELIISPKHKINISIKFSNVYSGKREIESMTFENVVLDFKNAEEPEKNTKTYQFVLDL